MRQEKFRKFRTHAADDAVQTQERHINIRKDELSWSIPEFFALIQEGGDV